MNEDHIEKFSDIAEHLKAELNLMDADEYKKQKEQRTDYPASTEAGVLQ